MFLKLRSASQYLSYFVATLFILIQFGVLSYYIGLASGTRAQTVALDNDAANALDVVDRTRWYKSNGFHAYGPVYFRSAHTLSWFLPNQLSESELSAAEMKSRVQHFALLMTSLLSLYALGLLLGVLLSEAWPNRLAVCAAFVWIFLSNPVWQEFLVRAHPDLILSALVSWATFATVRIWILGQTPARLKVAGALWGVALATKLSIVMYLPFVVAGWLISRNSDSRRVGFRVIGYILLSYFAIGFPQNFSFARIISFLRFQSQFSSAATWDSALNWIQIWWPQFWPPLLGGWLFLFILRSQWKPSATTRTHLQMMGLAMGPLALHLLQNVSPTHNHYLMPVVALQMTIFLAAGSLQSRPRLRVYGFPIFVAAFLMFMGVVPEGLPAQVAHRMRCQKEVSAVLTQLYNMNKEDRKIFVDPYVPTELEMPWVKVDWAPTVEKLTSEGFRAAAFKMSYVEQHFDSTDKTYLKTRNPNWEAARDFYAKFRGKSQITDPQIGAWTRIYSDECTFEVWKKDDDGH